MNTTIKKWGNSQAVRLPKNILELSQITENENVKIVAKPNMIIIEKISINKHKTLKERLLGFNDEYVVGEFNTGSSVGSEIF